jgi:hypothetical protein
MFMLAALAFLQAASPPAVSTAMSTPELAAGLLPPPLASRVVRHEISPAETNGAPARVRFYTRYRSMPDGFCERDLYDVATTPNSPIVESADIRLGRCPRAGVPSFTRVNSNANLHVAQGKAALRWLGDAIDSARTREPLAFDVSCAADAQPRLCADGGRKALASVAIADVASVDGAFTCRTSETSFALRHRALGAGKTSGAWDVRLARGTKRPRLTLTWVPGESE